MLTVDLRRGGGDGRAVARAMCQWIGAVSGPFLSRREGHFEKTLIASCGTGLLEEVSSFVEVSLGQQPPPLQEHVRKASAPCPGLGLGKEGLLSLIGHFGVPAGKGPLESRLERPHRGGSGGAPQPLKGFPVSQRGTSEPR